MNLNYYVGMYCRLQTDVGNIYNIPTFCLILIFREVGFKVSVKKLHNRIGWRASMRSRMTRFRRSPHFSSPYFLKISKF